MQSIIIISLKAQQNNLYIVDTLGNTTFLQKVLDVSECLTPKYSGPAYMCTFSKKDTAIVHFFMYTLVHLKYPGKVYICAPSKFYSVQPNQSSLSMFYRYCYLQSSKGYNLTNT